MHAHKISKSIWMYNYSESPQVDYVLYTCINITFDKL